MENEVEIKLLFENKKDVLEKLGPSKKFLKRRRIFDEYFSRKGADMSNTHSLLRVREIKKERTELTFKGKARDSKNVWHRREITVQVNSPKRTKQILKNIGFNKVSEYESRREYWQYKTVEIVFIEFSTPAHLQFIEIEADSEKDIRSVREKLGEEVEEAGEEIFQVFDRKRKNL